MHCRTWSLRIQPPKATHAAISVILFRNLIDASRPRLWYIRTLLRLKWRLWVETGSSRINGTVLSDFTDLYDEAPKSRLHRTSMDFCNYAVKQLVGVNGMWWILYAFCPFFLVDERNMFQWGYRLRYMILKLVLLPTVADDDQKIVRPEDQFVLTNKSSYRILFHFWKKQAASLLKQTSIGAPCLVWRWPCRRRRRCR